MKAELEKLIEIYKDKAENEYSSDAKQQAIFYGVIADLRSLLNKEECITPAHN